MNSSQCYPWIESFFFSSGLCWQPDGSVERVHQDVQPGQHAAAAGAAEQWQQWQQWWHPHLHANDQRIIHQLHRCPCTNDQDTAAAARPAADGLTKKPVSQLTTHAYQ